MSRTTTALVCAALLAALPTALSAQSSGGIYTLTRHTVDNGGGYSVGGIYEVSSTIGQPDAAPTMSGTVFVLQPGFWGGYRALPTGPDIFRIFRDGFED